MTTTAHVDVSPPGARSYRVVVGPGLAARAETVLAEASLSGPLAVVSTAPIWRLVRDSLSGALTRQAPILIPDGERFKTLQTVGRIFEGLLRAQADRGTIVVAVGGGVVGDTAGFAAATFMRGLPLVHVPTTLLAQVDSAVGGKVGVNHAAGKNLIGAFHQPHAVLADPLLLATLPRRQFRSGLYEVVKYGMIASPSLFTRVASGLDGLFNRDPLELTPIIAECCAIKAGIVERDEREQGERRVLNLGHTVGHALEALTHYRRFCHGEAVGYGMLAAAHIAAARRRLARDVLEALTQLIAKLGPLPPVGDLRVKDALEVIRHDKKNVHGTLRFVLPVALGRTEVVADVSERELTSALRQIGLKG